MSKRHLCFSSLLIALAMLLAGAGPAHAQEDDDDDGASLVQVNDNSVATLVQACHNQVPVNVLGVQVPVQEIAAAVGITLGSDDSPATGPDSSCDQASGQDNQGASDTENKGSGQDQSRENSPPAAEDEPGDDAEEEDDDDDGLLGAILSPLFPDQLDTIPRTH